jgi:hypothetical protein
MDFLAPVRYATSFTNEVLHRDLFSGILGSSISIIAQKEVVLEKRIWLLFHGIIAYQLLKNFSRLGKKGHDLPFTSRVFATFSSLVHAEIRMFLLNEGLKKGNSLPIFKNMDPKLKIILAIASIFGWTYLAKKQVDKGLKQV